MTALFLCSGVRRVMETRLYSKRFCNDFFLNHNTIALVHNCLKTTQLCVVIEAALAFQLDNVPFSIKFYHFVSAYLVVLSIH